MRCGKFLQDRSRYLSLAANREEKEKRNGKGRGRGDKRTVAVVDQIFIDAKRQLSRPTGALSSGPVSTVAPSYSKLPNICKSLCFVVRRVNYDHGATVSIRV